MEHTTASGQVETNHNALFTLAAHTCYETLRGICVFTSHFSDSEVKFIFRTHLKTINVDQSALQTNYYAGHKLNKRIFKGTKELFVAAMWF